MSKYKLAFICDDVAHFDQNHDSTWAMMRAAHEMGHDVCYTLVDDLSMFADKPYANFRELNAKFFDFNNALNGNSDKRTIHSEKTKAYVQFPEAYVENNPLTHKCLDDFDFVFMRKDPPFNINYVFVTNLLSFCKKALVVNKPQALRDFNEKLAILHFPELICPTIVSKDADDFSEFLEEHKKIVLKPLDGKGGEGIFVVDQKDKNFASILESLSDFGNRFITAQKYIPEIKDGDKRVILANGELIGAMKRIPSDKDHRGNMRTGGSIAQHKLSKRDLEICDALKDFFVEHGIYFAGIDIIGDYLTEINITSPTCLHEVNSLDGLSGDQRLENQLLMKIFSLKN